MSSVLFPIAPDPDRALSAPIGRATLESAARALAGGPVTFTRALAGPAFETRQAALEAYRGRLDDDGVNIQPADRYCDLQAVLAPGKTPRRMVWRLSLGFWKTDGAPVPAPQARSARRRRDHAGLDPATLNAMAHQPMRPVHPQKALDIGLFEVRLPENPAIIIADE